MSALQEKFDQLLTEQEELRKKFQTTAQELFKETTKEFFNGNPAITAVVWTQYTPYFNDGDTCEFSVGDPTFTNASDPENVRYGEYDGDEEGVFAVENPRWVLENDRDYYKEEQEAVAKAGGIDIDSCEAFSRMICSSAMEDVMLAMFGDHVKVIATREGFDVEDHDHD
jgi:hypothetical protein